MEFGEPSSSFEMTSCVQSGYPVSSFLFNFMEDALGASQDASVKLSNNNFCNLCCADDLMSLFESAKRARRKLDKLTMVLVPFGMCIMLSLDWTTLFPNLILGR